jgi:site-specific recombinase XerD
MTQLRRRMIEDMQIRNLAAPTQTTYLQHVSQFARHFGKSPELLGPNEIRAYQLYLVQERKFAPASMTVAISALRFLYKVTLKRDWNIEDVIPTPKTLKTLPIILSPEEVLDFLDHIPDIKHRTILTTCYAAGLRIEEAVRLQIPHIDSQRMVIRVELGKGRKDRYVMLSVKLLEMLRQWWSLARPRIWLFPGESPDGHITENAVQCACRRVCDHYHNRKTNITPHLLRHCFSVHLLEQGVDVRTIQLLLGHRSLSTTARYLRIATTKVCSATSPLDLLPRPQPLEVKPNPPQNV